MQLVEPQNCAEAYNIRRGDKGRILVFGNHSLWLIPTDIGEICENKEKKGSENGKSMDTCISKTEQSRQSRHGRLERAKVKKKREGLFMEK